MQLFQLCIKTFTSRTIKLLRIVWCASRSWSSWHVKMINYNASPSNQCRQILFITQPIIMGDNTLTTTSHIENNIMQLSNGKSKHPKIINLACKLIMKKLKNNKPKPTPKTKKSYKHLDTCAKKKKTKVIMSIAL